MNIEVGCQEARDWLETQPDAQTAWDACQDPLWMLWWCEHCGVDSRTMRLLAVGFARSVAHLTTDARIIAAIDVAERFANGQATDAARAAAYAADARADARAAACAATDAAYAAARAAYAASYCAARAAYAAADAAADAPAQCAMIRAAIPTVPQKEKTT